MHTYAATYITGLGDLVEHALKHDIPELEILGSDDGLVVFTAPQSYEQLVNISYINNLYYTFVYDPALGQEKSVHAIVKLLTPKASFPKLQGKTFRLMVMRGSQLEHVTKEIATKMKDKIQAQTGLSFSPLKADVEFWVLVRNNGAVMFGYKRDVWVDRPKLEKGELRPKVAELLVMASNPTAEDVFLDPFAGYGALPLARTRLDACKKIILCEKKGQLVDVLKKRFRQNKQIDIHQTDALQMNFLGSESIDVIVTDPPWGMYEEVPLDMPVFYSKMLAEFARVIKQDGRIVVLTGQPEAFEVAVSEQSALTVKKTYTTLINGKKASVYVMEKAPPQPTA